jgi:tRNA threonylcarbamoyladenosine biosynthesis protein TsaE
MKREYLTLSVSQTKNLGKKLARELSNSLPKEKAIIIALEGELGSGKTTFLQGFAKGLGIKDKILSPTFVLMKKYQIPNTKYQFYHIDCYRIKKPKELLTLGFEEIISNPKNIVAIEWAEKVAKLLPKENIVLDFRIKVGKEREIKIKFIS